jgi:GTPase
MNFDENARAGYIAISGKPNVGKSTLLNGILGRKIAITSRKPQTTRQSILGIKTLGDVQMMFVDTPGIHLKQKSLMNRRMNSIAKSALHDVHMVLFVTDLSWDQQDEHVLELMKELEVPVILVINKVDHLKDKDKLLPLLKQRSDLMDFEDVIPISALKQQQINLVESKIFSLIPLGIHFYTPEQLTNRSDSFMIAEMVREKLMRLLGQEIPYRTAVTVESLAETKKLMTIHVLIWVDSESHKHIVIGKGGAKLKQVGTEARADIEKYFEKKVLLKTWVKVKSGWSDNLDFLNRTDLGK